ncbi:MAG: SPOR domain-containing protein [Clostridia bacterium]|nr:SPOR domain-containing protein [Clostridia bacterium]
MKNKEYRVYEVKTKKTHTFSIAVIICGLLLSISVCNLVSFMFFSNGIDFVSGKQRNANNFYAVEVNSFDTYDDAYNFATTLQQKGGAGYITYNKKYKVLSSLYLTYDNAKSVADNIKGEYANACVYEIVLPEIVVPDDITKEQQNAITTSFAVTKSAIATMTNIYLGLDKGEMQDTTAHTMLTSLYDECADQVTSIKTAFHSLDTATYLRHRMYLTDFASNLAEISTINLSGIELSQIIKYQQIKCAFLYISMANLFQ